MIYGMAKVITRAHDILNKLLIAGFKNPQAEYLPLERGKHLKENREV